ncbi:MAG: PilW family protein [Gammaproteobacteria bacterium]|nr:PilW family protein [Gammaproteobacteria bacterium]MBU1724728.1 PilW family protein [Gammaproteobacteria bacterium]MBU2005899.1 PilW family protein [Gammaproteobacteria bacterium]
MTRRKSQRGVTLIEMMIAMVVSLVLIAGVGTIYISSKRNYQARDQFSMMDENARIALNSLKKHLEHAGYAANGVFPLPHPFVVGGQPAWAPCGKISLNRKTSSQIYLTQDGAVPAPPVNVQNDGVGIAFLSDDSLFTDCGNSSFDVDTDACRASQAPSSMGALVYNSFSIDWVAGSREQNSVQDFIPTLYCSGSASGSKQMIAQGIERMELMYGVDSDADGSVEQYLTANNVGANWPSVISIKVGLLVKSLEPVLQGAESRTYDVLGNTVTTNDRYQRSVYTEVIHLRNRV